MARDGKLEEEIRKKYVKFFVGRRVNNECVLEGLVCMFGKSRVKVSIVSISSTTWHQYASHARLRIWDSQDATINNNTNKLVKKLAKLHTIINHSGKIVWFVSSGDLWAVTPLYHNQWEELNSHISIANVIEG